METWQRGYHRTFSPAPYWLKRQLFDIVTSATPITESILFSPQFVDLDNIQLGMFDAFLKASGGK